jgi:hypothetical protein
MEIIHNSYVSCIDIMSWKHISHTNLLKDAKSIWHSSIHRFVFYPLTHLSVCQTCFQCMIIVCKTYEPMNELRTIFIINSLHAKFMMYATRNAIICGALWHWPQELMINFILMGGLFARVLPIQRCVLDPIYSQFSIGMLWLLIKKKRVHF